jgi:apolipoprotein N-acyltransferase
VLTGLLLTLAFPRFGLPVFAWVALLPLFFLAATNTPAKSFTLGWIAGFCHGITLLYWITSVLKHYGNLHFLVSLGICFLLVGYLAIFPGLFCAGLSWLRHRHLPWLLLAPLLWTTLELGKSRLLTGFPWENLGYSQYSWHPIIQIADITGVYGISFILVFANAVLFYLFLDHHKTRSGLVVYPLVALVLISGTYAYGRYRIRALEVSSSPSLRVALIQGNIAQETKWDPAFQQATLERYLRLTSEAVAEKPDLVIWPETATPFYFLADTKNSSTLMEQVEKLRMPLLFGSPAYHNEGSRLRFYNRAYLLNHFGQVAGYYDKIHLVPFGEYVPLKKLLFFVDKLVQAAGDFAAGDRAVVLNITPARAGVLICYEAIFPKLSRTLAAAGANLLVNITNDAWFGRSGAPYQHLSMAVLRAVENRLPMARCANTGISALIDRDGQILQTTRLFEEATLIGTLTLGEGKTIYNRFGDWFAWSCLTFTLMAFLLSLRRKAVTSKR